MLAHDKAAHEHLAILEELYYSPKPWDFQAVVRHYGLLSRAVAAMINALLAICPSRYRDLAAYHRKFDFYVRYILAPPVVDLCPPYTVEFKLGAPSVEESFLGNKASTLFRLAYTLHLPTPRGFVITTNAFHYFLSFNDIETPINEKLATLDIGDTPDLEETASDIEQLIMAATIPQEITKAVKDAMAQLQKQCGAQVKVALRSSAVKEDGKASFAGQYRTLLNVDVADILNSYKQIIAGKYTSHALFYRISRGILDSETPMAVLVLEMIDTLASGVVYTRDITNSRTDQLIICSVAGQGDQLVGGRVSPDVIKTSRCPPYAIVQTIPGTNSPRGTTGGKFHPQTTYTLSHSQQQLSLDEASAQTLARWAMTLEAHFDHPQDIEWCKDQSGNLFVLQSRPLHSPLARIPTIETGSQTIKNKCLSAGGETVCPGTGSGAVYRLEHPSLLQDVPQGAVLVVRHGLPQFVTAMNRLAAAVVETGSRASHFSSIAREFGVPTLVNVYQGFNELAQGHRVTVDADNGRIYDGDVQEPTDGHPPQDNDNPDMAVYRESLFMDKLTFVMDFSTKLRLFDPKSSDFSPQGCRSLHDIIRFVHETAVKEMFLQGHRKGHRKKGARKLISPIPMLFYLLNVGRGVTPHPIKATTLTPDEITSPPMNAILKGLMDPGVHWSQASHFDWETHDRIIMSGGIISADSPRFGSYAVVSRKYVNINFRFGYHFVILDTFCTPAALDNYILFRFSGGGGDHTGRVLRAAFVKGVLTRLGFMVTVRSDLVDAEYRQGSIETMVTILENIGRLLGATKLMDMYIKNTRDVELMVDDFMGGRYDFRNHPQLQQMPTR
ncbi:PEP/pyruvate-binding domain-containing protein [Desulforapulum autotrophicum]|uniref:PEP/pyruvate-binding domain-containing protein n=1 Tax=Desulforapulum autotrophicum TaxID=2296 RepID=UPI0002F8D7FE|nr:PEP/pyruvate-binding domain-containing protein [Desulforapulum autotrophicum]